MPGDFEELVVRVREHYLEQFWQFVEEQKKRCSVGTNELKVQANGDTGAYRNLYCMDFATNENGEIGFAELAPDRFLRFDPLTFDCGRATLLVDHLHWNDVVIEHDLPDVPASEIATWFDRWFGPDDQQTDMIHSLFLKPGRISIDLGTAEPGALHTCANCLSEPAPKFANYCLCGRVRGQSDSLSDGSLRMSTNPLRLH